MWSDIAIMLSTIKNEKNAVESVLKGDVDQYVLDGADQVLKIPRCLLERVEQLPHQVRMMKMTRQLRLRVQAYPDIILSFRNPSKEKLSYTSDMDLIRCGHRCLGSVIRLIVCDFCFSVNFRECV